jgi:hypothetical protein
MARKRPNQEAITYKVWHEALSQTRAEFLRHSPRDPSKPMI